MPGRQHRIVLRPCRSLARVLLTALSAAPLARGAGIEFEFSAEEKSLVPGPDRFVLRGNVRIAHAATKLEAAGAVFNVATGEVYAEGPVILRNAEARWEVTCDRLAYNFRSRTGTMHAARMVVFPPRAPGAKGRIEMGEVTAAVVRAETIIRRADGSFSARDATVTSCEFEIPHWSMRARAVEVYPKRYIRARGITLYFGRAPVFHWPLYRTDISGERRPMKFVPQFGWSRLWGNHYSLELGWPLRRPRETPCALDMWGVSTGFRDKRGGEAGLTLSWKGTKADGEITWLTFLEDATSDSVDAARAQTEIGSIRTKLEADVFPLSPSGYLARERGDPVYGVDDVSGLQADDFTYAGRPRSYVEMTHWSRLGESWELEAQIHAASDRGVRQEYLEWDAKTGLPEATFLDLHRRGQNSFLSIYSGLRMNPFRTQTEYLPELRWAAPAATLGAGFLLSTEATAGWLRRSYDEAVLEALAATPSPDDDVADYEAFRARTRITLWRPFKLGPFCFSPYVGTDQAYYDHRRALDEPLVRGCAVYGGALSTKLYGRFDRGGRPYRHVVEFRADYKGVSKPTADPVDILGFDQADDLIETGRVRLTVDQRLQTKRSGRSHDLAGLLVRTDLFENPEESVILNGGRSWGRLKAAAFLSPGPSFRMTSAAEWDANDGYPLASTSVLDFGTTGSAEVDPGRDYWRVSLFHVSSRMHQVGAAATKEIDPSNEVGVTLGLAPAGRWHASFTARYETEERSGNPPGLTGLSAALVRDFHDWQLSLGTWQDPGKDDWGVTFSLVPRGFTVNVPPHGR